MTRNFSANHKICCEIYLRCKYLTTTAKTTTTIIITTATVNTTKNRQQLKQYICRLKPAVNKHKMKANSAETFSCIQMCRKTETHIDRQTQRGDICKYM